MYVGSGAGLELVLEDYEAEEMEIGLGDFTTSN
jgi:hypothetical protein